MSRVISRCCTWSWPTGTRLRPVDEDVGRHQHRVGEQADGRARCPCDLVLVGVRPLEQAHAGDRREDPGQLGHLGHVRLAEEGRLRGVEAERQVVEGDVADVLAQERGVLDRRQGVVVGDEVEALALVLQRDVLPDGAEVVAEVQLARRLDAGEDAGRVSCARHSIGEVRFAIRARTGRVAGQRRRPSMRKSPSVSLFLAAALAAAASGQPAGDADAAIITTGRPSRLQSPAARRRRLRALRPRRQRRLLRRPRRRPRHRLAVQGSRARDRGARSRRSPTSRSSSS